MENKLRLLRGFLAEASRLEYEAEFPIQLLPLQVVVPFVDWINTVKAALKAAEMQEELEIWQSETERWPHELNENTVRACLQHFRAVLQGLITKYESPALPQPTKDLVTSLRKHMQNISNPNTIGFLEEAVHCFEQNLYRAAVVLSWIGAVSLLYDYVEQNCLTDFNTEATKRNNKWRPAKNADDLTQMKEHDFLDILDALSIIGKNVKQELQECLNRRNACGHPNNLTVGQNMAAAHLETLILNVFSKF